MAEADKTRETCCDDFGLFQDVLKKMRTLDDRVVHALNTSIPTDSFARKVDASGQCQQLYNELIKSHGEREGVIKNCIAQASTSVKSLRDKTQTDGDNIELIMQLRKQQNLLRLMRAELNVEEVVRDRTIKVFHERCRLHYMPPDVKS